MVAKITCKSQGSREPKYFDEVQMQQPQPNTTAKSEARISKEQEKVLADFYETRKYVLKDEIGKLSNKTNLQESTLRNWFKKRRAKDKKKKDEKENLTDDKTSKTSVKRKNSSICSMATGDPMAKKR